MTAATPQRILFVNRPNIASLPGGDVVQMMETKRALEQQGLTVDVSTDLEPKIDGYDLVHLFNLETPETTLQQARIVKRSGRPLVLSTIYWDMTDAVRYDSYRHYGRFQFMKLLVGEGLNHQIYRHLRQRVITAQKEILSLVDAILPNSHLEEAQIRERFPGMDFLSFVIPNGVRTDELSAANATRFSERYQVKEYLLEVGRLGFIKNQLNLLRALRDWPHPIVLIGQETDPAYTRLCQAEARGRQVLFLPDVDRATVLDAFAGARVHALPSQKETVGLVSLEAALLNCRLVASTVGGQPEYLESWASYCDPNDLASIRRAVEEAWDRPTSSPLAEKIRRDYAWARAADFTKQAYEQVLIHSK